MAPCPAPPLLALSGLLSLAAPGAAQAGANSPPPSPGVIVYGPTNVRYSIPGTVKDLTRDAAGRILYCTAEGTVGRMLPGKPPTLVADASSGPFPNELRALAETSTGNIAVLENNGNVRLMTGGAPPATLVYLDAFMIQDASDLIVDQLGNYVIASATPSNGRRGMNWVQGSGVNWSYYLVKHEPLQLAHDPLTGGILLSETSSGGNLRLVQPDPYRTTTALDTLTHPGLSSAQSDGDMAVEADGDIYWIAGGSVYRHLRSTGTTALFASGYGQLRGCVIAAGSGSPLVPRSSTTGWSLYVAEGANPTKLREFGGVGSPAGLVANSQGPVPGRGLAVNVTYGFQAYELAVDNQGRLLLGGSQFGATHFVKRVTLTGTPSIATVATSANGLAGIIEGLCVAPDDAIYALSRPGTIQRITEGPLTLTTVFSDPAGQITNGKDLALDVDGTLYVAAAEAWGIGRLLEVAGGSAALLTLTDEARGLAANPSGGVFVSQFHNSGFNGTVDLFHFAGGSFETLPGLAGINYANGQGWGDGDICVDANGSIYTVSEDDWSLIRYDPAEDGFVRLGSGYVNHPSGLAIAASTAGSGSKTGWSLYVSEYDFLWEKPSVPPPASTLVDASLGLMASPALAGAPHPRFGKPRVLVPAPHGAGGLIGTAGGWVLAFDPENGEVRPLIGPQEGLRGDLVALAAAPDGRRTLALNKDGELFVLAAGRVRSIAVDAELAAGLVQRSLAHPQRTLRLRSARTGAEDWFALDGWVVWLVPERR